MRDTAKPLRRVGRRGERRSTWSRKAPLLPGGTTHELPWRRAPVRRRRHPYAWGRAALTWELGELRGSSPPPEQPAPPRRTWPHGGSQPDRWGICMQHMCKVIKAPYNIKINQRTHTGYPTVRSGIARRVLPM